MLGEVLRASTKRSKAPYNTAILFVPDCDIERLEAIEYYYDVRSFLSQRQRKFLRPACESVSLRCVSRYAVGDLK